jgi:5-methylthioadenosine/S-adenosylhomocysteine deaminase
VGPTLTPVRRTLIASGAVVSMDDTIGTLRRGDLLIEDGVIAAVAPTLDVTDCEVIDAEGMIVMPGLVDSHRHLWYGPIRGCAMDHTLSDMIETLWPRVAASFTPDALYACTRAGIADALEHGITTVLDWCHVLNTPDHASEAVRAHLELPMRAVFAYGSSMARKLAEFEGLATATDWSPARALRKNGLASDADRITMALAVQGPDVTSPEIVAQDVAVAREIGVPISMHVGVPMGPPPPRPEIRFLADEGLLGADMNFVHCCTTTDDEFRRLAAAGGTATVSPMAELALGMGSPATARMRDCGVPPAVGSDAVCSSSGDLFEEARVALLAERTRAAAAMFAKGRAVERSSELTMTAREALETITINGARACWLGDRVGSLTPGKAADVILLRGTDLNLSPLSDLIGTIVCCAHGSNVDTVLVGGMIVKRGGALVGIDVKAIESELVAARDHLYEAGNYAGMFPPVRGSR